MPDDRMDATETSPAASALRARRPRVGRFLVLVLLGLGTAAGFGILDRNRSEAELSQWTVDRSIASVDLISPKHATVDRHITLPADLAAFYTAPIRARVSGYVKMWYVDIGAKVKAGAILAKIDTPDLDQQYEEAKGELAKAKADYDLAVLTSGRWQTLRTSQAVSQQAADEKASDARVRRAEMVAAQAHVDRIKAMEDYKDIVAPFDGIVTARRIDVGALVSPTKAKALFDLSATDKMRAYVRVPQLYAGDMRRGLTVVLTLPQYPGRRFVGTVDTTSNAISDASRALLVEAVLPNPENLLTPGAYAQARFDLPLDPHKLMVAASAMIFRDDKPNVAVVKDGKVVLTPIAVLQDLGDALEISTGLQPGDLIVKNPTDAIETGDDVRVATIDGRQADGRAERAREARR